MKRNIKKYSIDHEFKRKARIWASQFDVYCILENNSIPYLFNPFDTKIAAGSFKLISLETGNSFSELEKFYQFYSDWLFGYFGYDLKNEIENLHTNKQALISYPDLFFFIPIHIIEFINEDLIEIISFENPDELIKKINSISLDEFYSTSLKLKPTILLQDDKKNYISTIEKIKNYIVEGDVYELTYCIDFIVRSIQINPLITFQKLIEISPMPFSSLLKLPNRRYIISASPERFLKKINDQLISQPIKGTIRRGITIEEDEQLKSKLAGSEKDQAENLMIVDLVRNDLARSSQPGSVKVEELFGVYSFAKVHQLISTVSSRKLSHLSWVDCIRNAFPMGSMTGAPKIKSMQLIDQYEKSARNIFSGALGYINPQEDFDFNVLIRSLFYDEMSNELFFKVGSAITYDSDPEQEWEECLLKAAAIQQVLLGSN